MRKLRLILTFTCALGLATASAGCGESDNGSGENLVEPATIELAVTASPTAGLAPLEVSFDADVEYDGDEELSFSWDFGDGSEGSTEAAPAHTYAEAGSFTATLTVSAGEISESASTTIEVGDDDQPVVEASASSTTGLAPLSVSFQAEAIGGNGELSYAWDFGDGESAAVRAPAHVYAEPGEYTATVTVTDADGDTATDSVVLVVEADETPSIQATAEPSSGIAPLPVVLDCQAGDGNPPYTVRWEFGDGGSSTYARAPHTYVDPGTFRARCVVTDADGDSISQQLTIDVAADERPVASLFATPRSGDAPLEVGFEAVVDGGNGQLIYDWNLGDGTSIDDGGKNVTHTFSAAGDYQARVTVTDEDGDVGVAAVEVKVATPDGAPTAEATVSAGDCAVPGYTQVALDASASADPEGAALTYDWAFVSVPAGSTARFNNAGVVAPTFVPDVAGDYVARVFVSDGAHRVASSTVTITADDEVASISTVSGDAQSSAVAEVFASPFTVELHNGCGAPLVGEEVTWSGTNVAVMSSTTQADDAGQTSVVAMAGTTAGAASLVAGADAMEAIFTLSVEPGPPAFLLVDAPASATVSDTTAVTLEVTATDQFGNTTTSTEVDFDISLGIAPDLGGIGFDSPSGPIEKLAQTTSGGKASFQLFSTTATSVPIRLEVTSSENITPAGRQVLLQEDFETADGWNFRGPPNWEIGVPTSGPGAALSGSQVLATDLDGDFAWTGNHSSGAVLEFSGNTLPLFRATLSFSYWYDIPEEDDGCTDSGAWVNVGGSTVEPFGGYTGHSCLWGGYTGQSEGWRTFLGEFHPWSLSYYPKPTMSFDFQSDYLSPRGAGMYVDDIVIHGYSDFAVVNFEPGPAAALGVVGTVDGVGHASCGEPGLAGFVLEDAYGNRLDDDGVGVELAVTGSAMIQALIRGDNFSGPGAQATGETFQGELAVAVVDAVGESVDVTAQLSGDPSSAGVATIAFPAPVASEAGLCGDGIDNDCDGLIDCQDSDCTNSAACQLLPGESCTSALWLGDSYVSENHNTCTYQADGDLQGLCPLSAPGRNDINFTYTAVYPGFYTICVQGTPDTILAVYGPDNVCATTGGFCELTGNLAEGCVKRDMPSGDYRIVVEAGVDCGPTSINITPPSGVFNMCSNSCECGPMEACYSGQCEPALRCADVCDEMMFCDIVEPGTVCSPYSGMCEFLL